MRFLFQAMVLSGAFFFAASLLRANDPPRPMPSGSEDGPGLGNPEPARETPPTRETPTEPTVETKPFLPPSRFPPAQESYAAPPAWGLEGVGYVLNHLAEPWTPAQHFSRQGVPYVHLFFMEPATPHRDLFFDFSITNNGINNRDEQEMELELEWALSKWFGVVLALPYRSLNPVDGPMSAGFGDATIGGRAMCVEADDFVLSSQMNLTIPTGFAGQDLGRGEVVFSPMFLGWFDLGGWTALHSQIGLDVGLETGDTSFVYGFALTCSFQGPMLCSCRPCWRNLVPPPEAGGSLAPGYHRRNNYGSHYYPGQTSFILEMLGDMEMHKELSGKAFMELLPGLSYALTPTTEVRVGIRFPMYKPNQLDAQYIFSYSMAF